MDEKELLKRALTILKELKEHGSFFSSAIELCPYGGGIDGEVFEEKIDKLIEDSNKWQPSSE